jgi:hypothetical protein
MNTIPESALNQRALKYNYESWLWNEPLSF